MKQDEKTRPLIVVLVSSPPGPLIAVCDKAARLVAVCRIGKAPGGHGIDGSVRTAFKAGGFAADSASSLLRSADGQRTTSSVELPATGRGEDRSLFLGGDWFRWRN